VREQHSTARRVAWRIAPVRRRFQNRGHRGKCESLLGAFDSHGNTLARDRPGHQQYLPLMPCDHSSAGSRAFDGNVDGVAWIQHHS
jgi:hypothetical protein